MKKISAYFCVLILIVLVFLLGFDYTINKQPNKYYQVYLDDELIGIIESRSKLEDYINSQADNIRDNVRNYKLKIDAIDAFNKYSEQIENESYSNTEKVDYLLANKDKYNFTDMDLDNLKFYRDEKLYEVSNADIKEMRNYISANSIYEYVNEVYIPNGIKIKKIYTYHEELKSVEEIYKEIIEKKSCTIAGYKFVIKSNVEGYDDIEIYTLDKKIFSDAIEDMISVFVDASSYERYKNNNQQEISTTGSIIENVYVEQDITYKAVNIPVEKKIYSSSKELSKYLLYGDSYEEKIVNVDVGDSVESVAFKNEISVQEFLISNPQYTSRDNLLVPGAEVKISKVNPKIQIVEEIYEVVDKETDFTITERYDENINKGTVMTTQEGVKGLERVSQNVKIVNGEINYVDPVAKEVIKTPVPQIITIGARYVPDVGSTSSWGWPTNSGYTISSYYGYRLAVFGEGNLHTGIDIAGTGYGSPVYASNNGVIYDKGYKAQGEGNYIIIDHNNGFYSLYGHMSAFADGIQIGTTVERGQVIGYVGSSGWATGPHLHFEIRVCPGYTCHVDPMPYLMR